MRLRRGGARAGAGAGRRPGRSSGGASRSISQSTTSARTPRVAGGAVRCRPATVEFVGGRGPRRHRAERRGGEPGVEDLRRRRSTVARPYPQAVLSLTGTTVANGPPRSSPTLSVVTADTLGRARSRASTRTSLTAALVDVESVSGDEARIADAGRGRAARCAGAARRARRQRGAGPHRSGRVRSGWCWPATWTPCPIAGNVPSRLADGVLHGCGTVGHEVRAWPSCCVWRTWSGRARWTRASI